MHAKRELVVSAAAVLLSAATVVTCSALAPHWSSRPSPSSPPNVAPTAKLPPSAPPQLGAQADPGAEQTEWTEPAHLGTTPEGNPYPILPRFFNGLLELAAGKRRDHVRVVWLGDSHTQADVWTDKVRAALQKRFGNGGPGFVHVGWNTYGYRHGGVEVKAVGRWLVEPKTLVSQTKVDDGVFGLGGIRLIPKGRESHAAIKVGGRALKGRGTWDLAIRFMRTPSSIQVKVSGAKPKIVQADSNTLGLIRHVELRTTGPGGELWVGGAGGAVQLMGVVIESEERPGVVVDTLGLNGARYRTSLAWEATAWVEQLARRQPDLIVLAFGTNESSNLKIRPDRHIQRVKELLGRVRAAAPYAECLIFGPIDRAGLRYSEAVAELNAAQSLAAEQSGCAFWNGQAAMGGKGSWLQWSTANPPLAAGDGVHLHSRGYERLGNLLARDLLAAYGEGAGAPDGAGGSGGDAPSDSR